MRGLGSWAMHTSYAETEKPELLIVDTKRLRQAAIMRLLETWADAMGLTVKAGIPDDPLNPNYVSANCEIVIISVGSASIQDAQYQTFVESVRKLMPQTSLIIISDREDPKEVCAAFQEGAIGFMPTTIEPALAFHALSFIRSGGAFFPPSVLSTCLGDITLRRPAHNFDLTIKQEGVFDLLCQGHSNKVIAHRLGMSEAIVKVHARQLMHKFGVTNRTQLAVAAMGRREAPEREINGEQERNPRRLLEGMKPNQAAIFRVVGNDKGSSLNVECGELRPSTTWR
jgi:two-component system, NarL family, nitrate/nitrite response regulator NarL